jgi:hypothetical protein
VFTTTSHVARFLPLDTEISDPNKVEQLVSVYDQSSRRVERGAKIVVAVQDSPKLVLQASYLDRCRPSVAMHSVSNFIVVLDASRKFGNCESARFRIVKHP